MNQITEVTRRDIFDIINFGFTKTIFVDKPHPNFCHYRIPEDQEIKYIIGAD